MRYFDYNATTPLHPEALEAWQEATAHAWYNPSGMYRAGARAHVLLEQCRKDLANILGCPSDQIVFNSGATEGNNSLLRYLSETLPGDAQIAVSPMEHPSVLESAEAFFKGRVVYVPVLPSGVIDLSALDALLVQGHIQCVSIMALHNETGIVQPWQDIQRCCKKHRVWYHCDASQWLGKLPAAGLGECDFVTGCAHKFQGPKATGFLKIHPEFYGFKSFYGGGQELGRRAGTEDYPSIAAMLVALKASQEAALANAAQASVWKTAFEQTLVAGIPEVSIVGEGTNRVWNTAAVVISGVLNNKWLVKLEKHGFLVSMRAACSAEKRDIPTIYNAMGYTDDALKHILRISSGWTTTQEDWQALARAMIAVQAEFTQELEQSAVITL